MSKEKNKVDVTKVPLENIRDVFFSMEENEDLFSLQVAESVYIWNISRWIIYQRLLEIYGVGFISGKPQESGFVKFFAKSIVCRMKNFLALRYLLLKKPEYIFFTAQRTLVNNRIVDNISDHLIVESASNSVAIELINRGSISYPHMLLGFKTRIPPVSFIAGKNRPEVFHASKRIAEAISKYFGIYIDIADVLGDSLGQYQENFKFFSLLFSRHSPKAIIGVNNDTLNGLYFAAKIYKIPTVELQHGSSNEHTILWSYPKSIDRNHVGLSLPLGYFTFSDYWTDNTYYPVQIIRSIGNDNLCQDFIASKSKAVLFISAYMYHDALVELAKKLCDAVNIKIYFKLHPHEYNRRNETIEKFQQFDNIEIVSDGMEFKDLYRLCSHVVVVHSTTAYQALQAGKCVCIYKYSNYFWHSDIFKYANLFETPSELVGLIIGYSTDHLVTKNSKCLPLFYTHFDPSAFKMAVNEVTSSH